MTTILYISLVQVIVAFLFIFGKKDNSDSSRFIRYFLVFALCHLILKLCIDTWIIDPFLRYEYFIPFSFGYLPCIYLFTSELTQEKYRGKYVQLLHFSPLIIATAFYIFFAIYIIFSDRHVIMNWYSTYGYYFLGVQIVVYSFRSLYLSIYYSQKNKSFRFASWHTISISSLFLGLGIMIIIDMINPSLVDYELAAPLAYVSLTGIFILILHMQLRPNLEVSVTNPVMKVAISQPKYSNSTLSNDQMKDISLVVEKHLKITKAYLDKKYNLDKLSKQTTIPKHHISQSLNEINQIGFNQLINKYRIDEFCNRVNHHDDTNPINVRILSYQCGFNSKSSFHQNFKRLKKVTPAEYITEVKS